MEVRGSPTGLHEIPREVEEDLTGDGEMKKRCLKASPGRDWPRQGIHVWSRLGKAFVQQWTPNDDDDGDDDEPFWVSNWVIMLISSWKYKQKYCTALQDIQDTSSYTCLHNHILSLVSDSSGQCWNMYKRFSLLIFT